MVQGQIGCERFKSKNGIDFDEIFSPVVKMDSIRVVFGIAATINIEIKQLDVKTIFLHGDLEEEIYMELPDGFMVAVKKDLLCRLKKNLYGSKQALRQWHKKFESFMTDLCYHKTQPGHYVCMKKYAKDDFIILLQYVDYMLIAGNVTKRIALLKKALSKPFAMKDWD
jgi:ATP-binding cassette subfamily B (MDR/TAP) protein 1